MGHGLFDQCSSSLKNIQFPSELNLTTIFFIPKCTQPTSTKDLWPIALCNVEYKIMAMVLAHRLKDILPLIISDAHSTFVPGRSISDNVFTVFEVIHYMK